MRTSRCVHHALGLPYTPGVLSSSARAYLRSLAHGLDPVVLIGAEGITDGVCRATHAALEDHELIKVRLGQGFAGDRRGAAERLAEATGAEIAQRIGRVVVLYRRRSRNSKRPRIQLPTGS